MRYLAIFGFAFAVMFVAETTTSAFAQTWMQCVQKCGDDRVCLKQCYKGN